MAKGMKLSEALHYIGLTSTARGLGALLAGDLEEFRMQTLKALISFESLAQLKRCHRREAEGVTIRR